MRIAVHLHKASHPVPLIRQIDIAIQMKSLSRLKTWMEFISGQTQTLLPDGSEGVHLCDLQRFCRNQGIKLIIVKGLPSELAYRHAVANSRLSGLILSQDLLELLGKHQRGEISTHEAISLLMGTSK